MSDEKDYRIPFNAPLNTADSEKQTFGCRHTNPDICNSCYMDGVCAFVRDDHICKKPSKAWKRQFEMLKLKG